MPGRNDGKAQGRNYSYVLPTDVSDVGKRSLEDVGMQYSLPVMFQAFPVVRRQNTAVNTKDH